MTVKVDKEMLKMGKEMNIFATNRRQFIIKLLVLFVLLLDDSHLCCVVQLKLKQDLSQTVILFKDHKDFDEFIKEVKPEWIKPRPPNSTQYRSRKHPIEASFIGTFCVLRGGQSLRQTELTCSMDNSLIHIDIRRNVHIINNILDYEISMPSHQEQLYLLGLNDDFNGCIVIDATDIPIKKQTGDYYNWIYKSWKVKTGFRNLVIVDIKGEIRDCLSVPAGYNNDQAVLKMWRFFRGDTYPGSTALSDSGFTGLDGFMIDKPFNKPQRTINPYGVSKNKNIVECVIGIVKMQWGILRKPFEYSPSFFPAVFRCCCILTNRYFRLYGYPGKCRNS